MLQQTQVSTVVPYFERFMQQFPTLQDLARAPLEEVLSLWKGLGYYARARNLHRGAAYVLEVHGGSLPGSLERLLQVPGIGRYTAGAILSIAFDQPVSLLDGNVARVYARRFGFTGDTKTPASMKLLWRLADALVPDQRTGIYNEALMELGATVCTPVSPGCQRCPIAGGCYASGLDDPSLLPVRGAARARPQARAIAVLLSHPTQPVLLSHPTQPALLSHPTQPALLFGLRPARGLLGGLWELPTLLWPENEGVEQALLRLGRLRLGVPLAPVGEASAVQHLFTHLELRLYTIKAHALEPLPDLETLRARAARSLEGAPARSGGALEVPYTDLRWVEEPDRASLPMGRATTRGIDAVLSGAADQLELFSTGRRG